MTLSADAPEPVRDPNAPKLVYKHFGDLSCYQNFLVCDGCSMHRHFCNCSDEVRDAKNA